SRVLFAEGAEEVETVAIGQPVVEEHEGGLFLPEGSVGFGDAAGMVDIQAFGLEKATQQEMGFGFVFDEEDGGGGCLPGRRLDGHVLLFVIQRDKSICRPIYG